MINTSMQLKAKVRNISQGDSMKSQILIRNYLMERLLERISVSEFKNNFIIKGGILVAAIVGLDSRATMDIDATVNAVTLSNENIVEIINKIICLDIGDEVKFRISSVERIMDEFEYPGVRVSLIAELVRLRQTIQLDFSTDDVITPSSIEYNFPIMFEDREISLMTYNIETLLGEKLQTVLVRGLANTRLRDFYDLYVLTNEDFNNKSVDYELLSLAFVLICKKRNFIYQKSDSEDVLNNILINESMKNMWDTYCKKSLYIKAEISWEKVVKNLVTILNKINIYI